MSLDVSDAIALAKDLLKTSSDYRPHDPAIAAEFSRRAFEICDDLGIDYALVGAAPTPRVDGSVKASDGGSGSVALTSAPAAIIEDEARQTSQQLRDLLQQQARVLETMREGEAAPAPKERRRGFRLFGRASLQGFGTLQSA
jgi:hypothetical protein